MKTISKKIIIYIFVSLLVFCSTSTTYYKSVHAMEWVGGALAFEEALKWLLASVGIISAGGMTADYWEQHGDDFVDYCEQQNITNAEVAEWQLKLCGGILDKASDCWVAFKEWASGLTKNIGVGSGSGSTGPLTAYSIDSFIYAVNTYYGTSFTVGSGWEGHYIYSAFCSKYNNQYYIRLFLSDNHLNFSLIGYQNHAYIINTDTDQVPVPFLEKQGLSGNETISYSYPANFNNSLDLGNYGSPLDISLFNINPIDNALNNPSVKNFDISGVVVPPVQEDADLNCVQNDVTDLDILDSDVPDETNSEVSIPLPGLGASDNTISQDAYDDLIDAINNGDIPIEKGIEDIQSILRVIAYDTETDDVFPTRPDPDDPNENVKKDDVINENKSNLGFTLAGLENVFPFCIPFDIYAFMTLLVADPVAPEFDFPIKSVNNQTEEIHVDLSPFEPVAVVVRYIFDFLFIIGLGMLTRSLIGGGSSD